MKVEKKLLEEQYTNLKKSYREISKEFNIPLGSIRYWMKKYNIPIRKMIGKNHFNWKGGKRVMRGYNYTLKPNHKRATKGYVRNCILVAEEKLGRILEKGEVVHHIDGNTLNDDKDNLYVYKNDKLHQKVHIGFRKICYELYKQGVIEFNNGDYKLKSL